MSDGMGPAMMDIFNELSGKELNVDETKNDQAIDETADGIDPESKTVAQETPDSAEGRAAAEEPGNPEFDDPDPHGFGPDKEGGFFDPEIHAVDDKGQPWKTVKKGTWAKKRGARKAPKETINLRPTPEEKTTNFILSQERDKELKALSSAITDLTIMGAIVVGGEAYQPKVDKEIGLDQRNMMIEGWTGYLKDTKWAEEKIPGWAGLALAYGYYLLPPMVTQPTVKQRIKRFGKKAWDVITLKWLFGGKKDAGTDVDSRTERKRENVVGKK